jgi:hypothetical protein
MSLTACSTLKTNKEKIIASMVAGLAAGAAMGAMAKPADDPAAPWLVLGGAAGAATGATIGIVTFDEEEVSSQLRSENTSLKAQLDQYKLQHDPQQIDGGSSLMSAPLPQDAKGLVKPGGWKRYKLDRWVQDSEN